MEETCNIATLPEGIRSGVSTPSKSEDSFAALLLAQPLNPIKPLVFFPTPKEKKK